jgi:hypothetical protein
MYTYQTDSPLSITASIAGILTFLAAILATLYVRWTYLRNADEEYFQVKNSLRYLFLLFHIYNPPLFLTVRDLR